MHEKSVVQPLPGSAQAPQPPASTSERQEAAAPEGAHSSRLVAGEGGDVQSATRGGSAQATQPPTSELHAGVAPEGSHPPADPAIISGDYTILDGVDAIKACARVAKKEGFLGLEVFGSSTAPQVAIHTYIYIYI